MKVGVVGASGLIGTEVRRALAEAGHEWVGFSRRPEGREGTWRSVEEGFAGLEAVVNVAGDAIAKRWTEENQKRFHASRVGVTESIVGKMAGMPESERPRVLVNASAVGFYGSRGDEVLTEESPAGEDYLAELCDEWEGAAFRARELGVRVVVGRIGVVLGPEADAWKRMKIIFSLGLGGKLGDGRQYWPWVHVEDVAGGLVYAVETPEIAGPVNLVGPEAVRNEEFSRELGKALHRPAILPVPAFGLKIVFGGFANALLASYNAVPKVLEDTGYDFRHARLEDTLSRLAEG